jgi:hypothetical protein
VKDKEFSETLKETAKKMEGTIVKTEALLLAAVGTTEYLSLKAFSEEMKGSLTSIKLMISTYEKVKK